MKISSFARVARQSLLAAALALALPACQPGQARLAQLEAAQRQQALEIAALQRQLAAKEDEVSQLETCVGDLENAVYDDQDSVAYDEERSAGPVAL